MQRPRGFPRRALALLAAAALCAGILHALLRAHDPTPGQAASPRTPASGSAGPTLTAAPRPEPAAGLTAQAQGVRVEGLLSADGHPCAGTVRAYARDLPGPTARLAASEPAGVPGRSRSPVSQAEAGADGRFAFERLPAGALLLIATTPAGGRGDASLAAPQPGSRHSVRIDVWTGACALDGQVLRIDGTPWQGQIVAVIGAPTPGVLEVLESLQGTPTDAAGRFRLEGLPTGEVWLLGWLPGQARFQAGPLALPRADPFVLTLATLRANAILHVTDAVDARPVGGALVSWWAGASGTVTAERRFTRVNADGEAVVDDGFVRVEHPGYAEADLGALAGATTEVRLVPLTGTRAGTVLEQGTGRPCAGAAVVATDAGFSKVLALAVADEAGAFTLGGLPRAPGGVLVLGGGWVSPGLEHRVLEPVGPLALDGTLAEPLRLEAVAAGRAAGRVLTDDGQPVPSACVEIAPRRLRYDGFPGALAWILGPWMGAVTDAEGRFEAGTLVPGLPHDLLVRAPGFPPTPAGPFVPEAGVATPLQIHLPAGKTLRVRVLAAEDDAPLAGVAVSAEPEGARALDQDAAVRRSDRLRREARSDAEGLAALHGVVLGPLALSASLAGRAPIRAQRTLWTAQEAEQVLRLERTFSISGRVRLSDGSSPEGLQVSLEADLGDHALGADGAFVLSDVRAGRHRLEVSTAWMGSALLVVEVEAGATDVDLLVDGPVPRQVKVLVVDPEGHPVPQFDVCLAQTSSGASWEGTSGPIEVEASLEPQWLAVTNARDASGRPLGLAPGLLGPIVSDGVERTLRLAPGLSIAGRVVDEAGKPVADAQVLAQAGALPDDAPDLLSAGASARSDATGRFEVSGLLPGGHTLRVVAPDGFAALAPLEVQAGRMDLAVRLERDGALELRLEDPAGRPLPGATVSLAWAGGQGGIGRFLSDAAGRVRLRGLKAGQAYALQVDPPGDRPEVGRLALKAWNAVAGDLRLPAARVVRGQTRDEQGRPVPQATIQAYGAEAWGGPTATSDAEGRFVLGHLPEGPLVLGAWAYVPGPAPGARARLFADEVPLPEPGQDLSLTLRPGATLEVRLNGLGPLTGDAWLSLSDGRPGRPTLGADVRPDGTARVAGLDPRATYSACAQVLRPTARIAYRAGIAGDAGAVSLDLVPTRSITGRVLGLPAGRRARVEVRHGALAVDTRTDRAGAFTLEGLPPGRWLVLARTSDGPQASWEASAEAEAGTSVELRLAPAAAPR